MALHPPNLMECEIDVIARLALAVALWNLGTNKILIHMDDVMDAVQAAQYNPNLFDVELATRPDMIYTYEVKMPNINFGKFKPTHVAEVEPAQIPYAVQLGEQFRITGESEILIEVEDG